MKHVLKCLLLFGIVTCNAGEDRLNDMNYGPLHFKSILENDSIMVMPKDKARIAAERWGIALEGAKNAKRPIPILDSIPGHKTALIVIDMQNVFLTPGAAIEVPAGRDIIPNINQLAKEVRDKGGRIIWFRYLVNENVGLLRFFESESYLGGDRISPLDAMKPGHPQFELHPDLDIQDNDIVMDKIRYSAVLGSSIVDTLQNYNIENVIITGVTTDVCAGNTAEDLMQMDFHIVVAWDGCAALDRLEHELYLARMFGLYGDVMSTEEIMSRMTDQNH